MRKALYQAEADRIGTRRRDDRKRARGFGDREISRHRRGDNDVWIESDQFGGQDRELLKVTVREPILETNVAALDVVEVAQAVAKGIDLPLQGGGGASVKEADESQ